LSPLNRLIAFGSRAFPVASPRQYPSLNLVTMTELYSKIGRIAYIQYMLWPIHACCLEQNSG